MRGKNHGFTGTPLHIVWKGMRARCNQPGNISYPRYGGRGIRVCKEWDNYLSFKTWAETAGYGPGLQIDRVDNDGNYSPENCKISTRSENCLNKKNNKRWLVFGELMTANEVSEKFGVNVTTFKNRMHYLGFDAETAATQPSVPRIKRFFRKPAKT